MYIVASDKGNKPNSRVRLVRFVFLLTVALIFFMFGALVHAYAVSGNDGSHETKASPVQVDAEKQQPEVIVVVSGDTLWSIAKLHAPEGSDLREYIHRIRNLNRLNTSSLQIGQKLLLP